MEELSQAVAMTLSLGNSVCENPRIATQVEVTNLKLVTDRASLLLGPPMILPVDTVSGGNVNNPESEIDRPENRNDWISSDAVSQECREEEILSPVGFCGIYKDDDLLVFNTDSRQSLPTPVIQNTGNDQFIVKSINLDMPSARRESTDAGLCREISDGSDVKLEAVVSIVKNLPGTTRSVFEVECVPLWGSVCICGRRPEMEDAVADVPSSIQIPIKMLVGDHHAISQKSQTLSHLTGHFFGVYDGHGGSQVANYCRDRFHLVLTEEIETAGADLAVGSTIENCKVQWEKVFMSCFGKVDDEVGGKVKRGITMGDTCISDAISGPLAPETVGSTAIVALICSSHLLVASCGDSRAVLYRGKEAVPLSVDHKPDREDEYARIEKSGGKVIQWNGYRVFGVLAMSRSIGDRYLKPWIIPDPEVMVVPRAREDECLILASDGLWDVMTNEEACESARRRILWWHKKNGAVPVAERGKGVDPAAQAAAEYLSALALQRGSKDNISVIVVDLKAQRKFKNRTVG